MKSCRRFVSFSVCLADFFRSSFKSNTSALISDTLSFFLSFYLSSFDFDLWFELNSIFQMLIAFRFFVLSFFGNSFYIWYGTFKQAHQIIQFGCTKAGRVYKFKQKQHLEWVTSINSINKTLESLKWLWSFTLGFTQQNSYRIFFLKSHTTETNAKVTLNCWLARTHKNLRRRRVGRSNQCREDCILCVDFSWDPFWIEVWILNTLMHRSTHARTLNLKIYTSQAHTHDQTRCF